MNVTFKEENFKAQINNDDSFSVVQNNEQRMDVSFSADESFSVGLSGSEEFICLMGEGIVQGDYDGPYTVTPSNMTQTLPTEGKTLSSNVVVNPIPSNYGLITWDGSTITVS